MDKRNNASRKAQRAARARKQRNRRIALTLCLMLVVCAVSVGGTLAWLVDKTDPVTNTFTSSGIDIDLTETWNTDSDNDGTNDSWSAQLIPGVTYKKDPKVTVAETTNVDIYLFVEFKEVGNPATYLTYTSTLAAANSGWAQGTGIGGGGDGIPTNVWYRTVKTDDATKSWKLLDGNKVTVKDTVKASDMEDASKATLTYTAYAFQLKKDAETDFTAPEAWAQISAQSTGN